MASWSFGETLLVAHTVGEALESLGASWYVGGSVASSVHGIPRATQEADIVATLRPGQGRELAALLGEDFYVDGDTAEQAIRARRSFNVIHLDARCGPRPDSSPARLRGPRRGRPGRPRAGSGRDPAGLTPGRGRPSPSAR